MSEFANNRVYYLHSRMRYAQQNNTSIINCSLPASLTDILMYISSYMAISDIGHYSLFDERVKENKIRRTKYLPDKKNLFWQYK